MHSRKQAEISSPTDRSSKQLFTELQLHNPIDNHTSLPELNSFILRHTGRKGRTDSVQERESEKWTISWNCSSRFWRLLQTLLTGLRAVMPVRQNSQPLIILKLQLIPKLHQFLHHAAIRDPIRNSPGDATWTVACIIDIFSRSIAEKKFFQIFLAGIVQQGKAKQNRRFLRRKIVGCDSVFA